MSKPREDLTGVKFDRLRVKSRADDYISPQGYHFTQWICECDCGKTVVARSDSLKNRHTKSCGCMRVENNISRSTHGDNKRGQRARLYSIWANMIQRCTNKNHKNFLDYGGRGITVCDEWREYGAFRAWAVSNGYKEHLTLDRKNTNEGYTPSNCRWVSTIVQQNNKRSNHLLTYDGKTFDIAEWAAITGIRYSTLRSRVYLLGWSNEKALTTPVRKI